MKIKVISSALLLSGIFALTPAAAVDLIGVVDMAIKNDPSLKAQAWRRDATAENRKQALSALLPNISGSAGMSRGNSTTDIAGVQVSDNDLDSENYSVGLQQSVFDWGRYKQYSIAREQMDQAEASYEATYQLFLLDVATRYFTLLNTRDAVKFSKAQEKALKRQLEQAQQRYEVGLTAVTDVHNAQASYDQARATVIRAVNAKLDAEEGLTERTGIEFETYSSLTENLPLEHPQPASPQAWAEMALEYSPSVNARRIATNITKETISAQRAGHYPTLGLSASYNNSINNNFEVFSPGGIDLVQLENNRLNYGLRLEIPIFQGGRTSSLTRQASYFHNAAMDDLEAEQRAVIRQTKNSYNAIEAGIEEVQALKQALISAKSSLEATQAGFEVGTRTIVDVLIAEQSYWRSAQNYSTARHTYILAHLALRQATGILNRDDLETVNTLLQTAETELLPEDDS